MKLIIYSYTCMHEDHIILNKPSNIYRILILQHGCQDHCLQSYASDDFIYFFDCKKYLVKELEKVSQTL